MPFKAEYKINALSEFIQSANANVASTKGETGRHSPEGEDS
jgi:hypothetical protein